MALILGTLSRLGLMRTPRQMKAGYDRETINYELLFLRRPLAWQPRVRQAVNDYQQMQRLIEEVSELEWKRLKERKP